MGSVADASGVALTAASNVAATSGAGAVDLRLDSGLRLVAEPMSEVASVAIGFFVGVGSRDEPDELAGVSHFLEHLCFKGTPSMTARQIAEVMDGVGGDMNAFTTKEYTAFYVRLLADAVEVGLDVLCDLMWAPLLSQEDLDVERNVILDEILSHEDEPAEVVAERFSEALFPGHPLGREVLGIVDSVKAIDAAGVREFYARHYRPENVVVAVAGAIDPDAVASGIERRFSGNPGGKPPHREAPHGEIRPLSVVKRPTEQTHLSIGVAGLARDDDRRYALAVLDQVLAGGMSSRLFQEVREKRGLVYGIWSDRSAYADCGAFGVSAGTSPANAHEVIGLVLDELDRVVEHGITSSELERAKDHLRAQTLLAGEDSAARMARAGTSKLVHGRVLPVSEVLSMLQAVSIDDVSAVAGKVLPGPRALAVVGPFGDEDFSGFLPRLGGLR